MEFKRIDSQLDNEYLYRIYSENREFFRRLSPDLRREDILNIEALCQGTFYKIFFSNLPIGLGFLTRVDNSGLSCHLGFLLENGFQDKEIGPKEKYAFTAFKEFIRYIFRNTHLRKISLCFLKSREDIEKSLIRGGFKKEAEFKESVYFNGKFQDEIEYAIFKDDFIKLYGGLS